MAITAEAKARILRGMQATPTEKLARMCDAAHTMISRGVDAPSMRKAAAGFRQRFDCSDSETLELLHFVRNEAQAILKERRQAAQG